MSSAMRKNRRESAIALIEVLVGMLIFTGIFIPAYTLYVQSRGAVFKSKLALVATLAAQEEAEDWRLLARLAGTNVSNFKHDWMPVTSVKNAMDRLTGDHEKSRGFNLMGNSKTTPPELNYPEVYKRIWTNLEVKPSTDGFVYPATLHVLWQEEGETFTAADLTKKEAFSRFDFYLIRPLGGI